LSFYKIFGFPNLGALIVRKEAAHAFDNRRYFGGGTTDMITCEGEKPWVARKQGRLHERLEDGTGPTHSIVALNIALSTHEELFGGMQSISAHTAWLAKCLYERLVSLRHANGTPVCEIYKDSKSNYGDAQTQGATVAFNIRRPDGSWVGSSEVGDDALKRNIYIRAGSVCNPAGTAHALGLSVDDLDELYMNGFRCGDDSDIKYGPLGIVRVTFGAMSTLRDVDRFMAFMVGCYVNVLARKSLDDGSGVGKDSVGDGKVGVAHSTTGAKDGMKGKAKTIIRAAGLLFRCCARQ
jgi:molybdenum cofactor sulfurtransferase